MTPLQQSKAKKRAGRTTFGVIARLVAVIAATFAFAAFSNKPAQLQTNADGGQATRADDRASGH